MNDASLALVEFLREIMKLLLANDKGIKTELVELINNISLKAGFSPTIAVNNTDEGYILQLTDVNGTKDIIVYNGSDGVNGANGISPTASISNIPGGHRVVIADINNTETFDILDGINGVDGANGIDGKSAYQSYLNSTTDNPKLTETEWSASRSNSSITDEQMVEIANKISDPLDKKKILFVGDSICEGVGAMNGTVSNSYPYWIGKWHPTATINNLGVGGMAITRGKGSSANNDIIYKIDNGDYAPYVSNADIIGLEGYINDVMNGAKLGYIRKGFSGFDTSTFCGAFEYALKYFKQNCKVGARIIYHSTHNVLACDYNKQQGFSAAASEICAKHGVEYIDVFALVTTPYITGLELHPSAAIHQNYIAPIINRAMVYPAPISGNKTTNYYKMNAPLMLTFYSGTVSYTVGETLATSGWRINMVRGDMTTYANVSTLVTYDTSDVNMNAVGTYPVHIVYSENGINLCIDKDVTVTESVVTPKTLISIAATKIKKDYVVGNTLDVSDVVVTATYSDNSTSIITGWISSSASIDMSTEGTKSLIISYTEGGITQTTTLSITVNVATPEDTRTVVDTGNVIGTNSNVVGTWTLYNDGDLNMVPGTTGAAMGNLDVAATEWYDHRDEITKVTLNDGFTNIGGSAFKGYTALSEVVIKGSNIAVGASVFDGCTNLSKIDLARVSNLNMYAFKNCTSMPAQIVLGATSLAENAIYYCAQITSIKFTGTPTSINAKAFTMITAYNSAAKLTNIYVPWSSGVVANAPWGATGATIHYDTVG